MNSREALIINPFDIEAAADALEKALSHDTR